MSSFEFSRDRNIGNVFSGRDVVTRPSYNFCIYLGVPGSGALGILFQLAERE